MYIQDLGEWCSKVRRAFSVMKGEAGTEKLFAGKYRSGGTLPMLLGEYILVV